MYFQKGKKSRKKLHIWYNYISIIQDMDQGPTRYESGNKPLTEIWDGKIGSPLGIKGQFLRIAPKDLRRFGGQ